MILYTFMDSPLGEFMATSDGGALTGLYFVGQKYEPQREAAWEAAPDLPLFARVKEQLDGYFSGSLTRFDIPLAAAGTLFQKQVWEVLTDIPYGDTSTYSQIAAKLGRPEAARAVGAAVGRNPITLIVPCHRVVGKNGSLTGFAGGLARKKALLEIESKQQPIKGIYPL